MASLLNKQTGNLEEVANYGDALQAGTHAIPLVDPKGNPTSAPNMTEAQNMMQAGYTQPNQQETGHALEHATVNTPGEKLGTLAEGTAEGLTFGLSSHLETGLGKLLGIDELSPEMLRRRHEYNEGFDTAGNMLGIGLGMLTGSGEARILEETGNAAVKGAGKLLGQELTRTGSLAAKNMVQGALATYGGELSKFAYDPNQTAEKAIAHTSMGAAISGIAGVALGQIPEMWNQTKDALKANQFLSKFKGQIDVTPSGRNVPDMLTQANVNAPAYIKSTLGNVEQFRNFGAQMDAERESASMGASKIQQGYGALKKDIHVQGLGAFGVNPDALPDIINSGDSQAAASARPAIIGKAAAMRDSARQAWKGLDPILSQAKFTPEIQASLADRGTAVKAMFASAPSGSDELGIMDKALSDVQHVNDLAGFQNWRSTYLGKAWGAGEYEPLYPRLYYPLKNTLLDFENDFKEKAVQSIAPNLVPDYQAARAATASAHQYIDNVNKVLKVGRTDSLDGWIAKASDPLKYGDGTFLSRVAPGDNNADAWLDYLKQANPEGADALKDIYRRQGIQKALRSGEFDIGKLNDFMKANWSPKVQDFVTSGPGGMARFAANMDALKAIPSAYYPSFPGMNEALKHWAGGLGAAIGHVLLPGAGIPLGMLGGYLATQAPDAIKLGLLKMFETGVVDVNAFNGLTKYFEAATKADVLMDAGIASIVNGKDKDFPKAAQPDAKGALALDKRVMDFQKNPGGMFGIGGNLSTYAPDHHQAVAQVAGRGIDYLQKIRPSTEPLGPLDNEKVTSKVDQAKYDRALNLVHRPLSILNVIKSGNLTPDHLAVMEGVYPALHQEIQKKLLQNVVEAKAKGKIIPYQQRLAISAYIGQNLDSTIGPMTMLTLMQGKGQQGGGAPGGPAGKKPPQSAYSKMNAGAEAHMTMAQRAEKDRVTPP